MTANTTPDNIVSATTGDNVTIAAATTALANSVQTALSLRQRYEFAWANAAARTTQAGMVNGSTGYQIDTKSEYIYDVSAWRLKTPYVEFTMPSALSLTSGANTAVTGWSINSSTSTDTTFATVATNVITLVQPGLYSISMPMALNTAGAIAADYGEISTVSNGTGILSAVPFAAALVCVVGVPFYRTTAANTPLYMFIKQTSGSTKTIGGGSDLTTALRIGRLG